MSKDITIGHSARLKIKAGIDKAFHAVAPTLGAVGMTALIDFEGLDPIISDDGVTILKNLEFKDKYENAGLKMLRKAALRTSSEGGDGTATTTVLTYALISNAFKEISNDSSKIQEVRERLSKGIVDVLEELRKLKREVKEEDIERIATISSLDPEVAKLIAEVIKEVGVNGVVTVEKGSKIGYTHEIVKGARFDRGLLAPYFINDFEKEQCILENPWIALIDRKVSMNEQINGLMKSIEASGNKSVLIIADDVDSIALATLIQNSKTVATVDAKGTRKQGTFDIACVKNPYNASRGKDFLFDMAALTGGTVVSEEAGMKVNDMTTKQCGKASKVIVTKDTCTIIGGNASEALNDRIKAIELKIEECTSEYEKNMLEERLAHLTGGIGVIRVGAYTDQDFNAKKLKFDNAINSTQAALQEGILPGGGIALFTVSQRVKDKIFKKALTAPFAQQALNAGIEEISELSSKPEGTGINFLTKEEVNMFDAGIIDPFKVVRLALESAVHIASTLVSTETVIVNEVETKE